MVKYSTFKLENGLRVVVNEDDSTPMAVFNLLYDVGSRDEREDKTGFAHLFEHLMFEGSLNVPSFDEPMHLAGGECNAFTSCDMTNYYAQVPANNLETVFWLESDRMLSLAFSEESLSLQKKVVTEEYKEHYINQPYGDVWHKLWDLSYKKHPYRWPVIGKKLEHIADVKLDDVKDFFFKYYRPNNAILTVSGGVKTAEIKRLAKKWFGPIPAGNTPKRSVIVEPKQTEARHLTVEAAVPLNALYMSFHICDRRSDDYHATDLINEVLSGGASGRLYQSLVKDQQLFSVVQASMSGALDKGLFFIQGKLSNGVSLEQAKVAVWKELDLLKSELIGDLELQKLLNKVESTIAFSETSLGNRAFYLAYFELLGNIEEINTEFIKYQALSPADINRVANSIFTKENCSTIYYKVKQEVAAV